MIWPQAAASAKQAADASREKYLRISLPFLGEEVGFEILQQMINWSQKSEDSIKNIIFYASFIFSFWKEGTKVVGQANSAGHHIF